MKRIIVLFCAIATLVAQDNQNMNSEDMAKAMQEMQKAMQQLNQASAAVEVIGFRDLKKVLPKKLHGKDLQNASGEKNAAMGMKMSKAEGEYGTNGTGPYVSVVITDIGTLQGMVGMSMAGWRMMEVDRESDTEMEQTFTYKGYKGFRKFFFERNEGEISLLIGDRVILELEFSGIEFEKMTPTLDDFDFDTLEALIKAAIKAGESN